MTSMANGTEHAGADSSAKTSATVRYSEPPSIEKLNWLIHLQHVRGETETCEELIKEEIANSIGRNEFLFRKKGSILRDQGKVNEALECYQKCLKLNPENSENLRDIGACLFETKRYKLALDAYKEAEKLSEVPDWQIFHKIAECSLVLGDEEQAKNYVKLAVQHGKNEISYGLLVRMLEKENDYKSALAVCRSAVESCPDSVDMLCKTGFLHLHLGENQQAFERFSDALALHPSCARALLGIGCITQSHGDIDVALPKYKMAIQFEPESVALWNNIGTCFHSKQKHIAAISCLKRALWIAPLNWKVLYNLGLVHLSINQPASAFAFLCAAVNLRADFAQAFSALGYALLELQDPENASKAFSRAVILNPTDPTFLLNTAVCFVHQGLFEEARGCLKNAHALLKEKTPNYNESKELYEKLSALCYAASSSPSEQKNNIESNTSEQYEKSETSNKEDCPKGNENTERLEMGPDEV